MNFKQFTEATSLPTEEEIYAAGETQRGEPEAKMLEACRLIQDAGGPPILVNALEHIGDLAHRASRTNALINVKEKVDRFIPFFQNRPGWMDWYQEIENGFVEGAAWRLIQADPKLSAEYELEHGDPKRRKNWQIFDDARNSPKLKELVQQAKMVANQQMKEYAEAHIKYNKPITTLGRLGKEAAVFLGNNQYERMHQTLLKIEDWLKKYQAADDAQQDIMFRS